MKPRTAELGSQHFPEPRCALHFSGPARLGAGPGLLRETPSLSRSTTAEPALGSQHFPEPRCAGHFSGPASLGAGAGPGVRGGVRGRVTAYSGTFGRACHSEILGDTAPGTAGPGLRA